MGCKKAYITDEWHGWGCHITGSECMFLYPSSKSCAELYGEGPDATDSDTNNFDIGKETIK